MNLKLTDGTLNKYVQIFMDAIGDGILIVNKAGIITHTNKAAWTMLGYKNAEQVEGKGALDLLQAVNNLGKPVTKKNAALFESIKSGKKINNAIRQFLRADQKRFWASITTTPIKTKGRSAKGAIIVVRDITEEKQQQEYQSNFADIASHSLRTPLGNVLWASEYLLSGKPGRINKIQKEYLEESHRTLKSMNTMVDDLLKVSRLPDKRTKPKMEKVCIDSSISQVITNYATFTKAKNVKIIFDSNRKNKFYVRADQKYLLIIIQNLIENAIHYAFNKTDIIINVKKEGKHIIFSCTNEGIGIPKDKQKFIFAKFFRAENAVKKQGNGTGLGLHITHEMVRLNNGKIWFESEENKKTTFYIQLNSY